MFHIEEYHPLSSYSKYFYKKKKKVQEKFINNHFDSSKQNYQNLEKYIFSMNIRIFEKFQVKSERGVLKSCQVCGQQFGVFTREHQCKRCLRAICASCGQTKRDVYKYKMNRRPHRICDICKPQSDHLIKYIAVNKLIFGEDSQIGLKWHKKIPNFQINDGNLKVSKRQFRKFTIEIFNEVWDAYNYSFRQMVGLMTYNINQNEVYHKILTVYEELERRGVDEKIENIIFVIVFMLCFSSDTKAVELIKFLYELKKTVTDGKQALISYLKALRLTDEQMRRINDYLNYKVKTFANCFSINLIPAQSSIYVLDRIFERKKIDELYMFLALLLSETKTNLILNQNNKYLNDLELLRNCDLTKITQSARSLASVNTSSFIRSFTSQIKSNNQKIHHLQVKEDQTQSQIKEKEMRSQPLIISPNFKKNKDQELIETHSTKTMSMKQIDDQRTSPRKISHLNNSNIKIDLYEESESQSISNIGDQCAKCREKDIRMKEMEQIVERKDYEISKLRSENENSESSISNQKENAMQLTNLILKMQYMEHQASKNTEKSDSLFHELTKQQKENSTLKLELQEAQTTNKMLKNKLESTYFSEKNGMRNTEKQEETNRMNQLLQKTLIQKNKQIEELMKKNKLLSFQLEQKQEKPEKSLRKYSRSSNLDIQVNKEEEKQVKQLMKKMKQMSEFLLKQEKEKMQLNDQLFELKQTRRNTIACEKMTLPNQKKEENSETCIIF